MSTSHSIHIMHRFDASAEKVFDAWLDSKTANQWLLASPTGYILKMNIHAKIGGSFHIVEQRDHQKAEYSGKYIELNRPDKLIFTLNGPMYSETLITIEIVPLAIGCELKLTHEHVPIEEKKEIKDIWTMSLNGLEKFLALRPGRF